MTSQKLSLVVQKELVERWRQTAPVFEARRHAELAERSPQSRHWRFCCIRGIAVQHWGEARLTRDDDLTIFTGIRDEASYIDDLVAHADRLRDWPAVAQSRDRRIVWSTGGFFRRSQARGFQILQRSDW
jgi:hypothetical protein